ncbi:hypothetical protein [Persicitalea jodogahamensis]|uniref:MG2 domain-containing protein n=1 Tax=Persicitalea jodogahamensis TaxID=402147 RepID=A0A8J3G8D6_9BACT|nr:hypothetical protein [Persicitalea jodogahamensis]GHB54489.1 hypothetical protein GCM10007390_04400 [Persicitalea jodogahamensis]
MKGKNILLSLAALVLVGPFSSFAQNVPLAGVQRQLASYTGEYFQEKIYVHVDRPLYVVGETMWFKIYCVAGDTHRALDVSKIAYLELIDKESNPVAQMKISLTDGQGDGNLIVPAGLANGTYAVRCYTNWMKNFNPDHYFETPVRILNPFIVADDMPAADAARVPAYELQFFPEGGNLVSQVENRVAFRAAGRDGKGVDFKGALVNAKNDTLLRFEPQRFGLGSFRFTPAASEKYRAILQDSQGHSFTSPLPGVQNQGYTMQVSDSADQFVKVLVRSQPESMAAGLSLLAHGRTAKPLALRPVMQNGTAVFLVEKAQLSEGITQLTVFDQNPRPVAERLYFKRLTKGLTIEAKTAQNEYGPREKVHLDLMANATVEEAATLSVSVYLLDSLDSPDPIDIDAYFGLTSDLQGTVESPATYLQETGTAADAALDHVMLTHGWRRFRWDEVLSDKKPDFKYLPEYGGHFIKGKITSTETGQPQKNVAAFLATPDLRPTLFIAESDSLGNLRFEVNKLQDTQEIIVQTNTRLDSTYRIEISSPYSGQASSRRWPQFAFSSEQETPLLTRSVNMQTLNAFMARPTLRPVFANTDSLAFFGKPDERYMLDAFTRFPTMEEVMREYVPGVFVRRRQKKFQFNVLDNITPQGVFKDEPLILLDGVPVFDTDKIMAFDPLKVKKLEVIDALYYLGPRSFPGIVSYTTYKGDLAGFELDPRSLVQSYDFAQSRREFYAPRYDIASDRASRLPDFRNLLHWSPTLTTNAQGKQGLDFYTSDQTGTYRVVVQGLTPGGTAGSGEYVFEVKPGVGQ